MSEEGASAAGPSPAPAATSEPGPGGVGLPIAERAICDLRCGAFIVLSGAGGAHLVQSAELLSEESLQQGHDLAGGPMRLVITARRATALGLMIAPAGAGTIPILLVAQGNPSALALRQLVDPTLSLPRQMGSAVTAAAEVVVDAGPPDATLAGGLRLLRDGRLLPAFLAWRLSTARARELTNGHGLTRLDLAIAGGRAARHQLTAVAEADVPLLGAERTHVIAFRPADGRNEHLAIVVGTIDPTVPMLVRIHSECFTGDLLGSLRCDCGDQLRGAIAEMGRREAGILLYLAQEGRGIGLVNKLRAYQLQDAGADTLEANEELGFDADERDFAPAAEMLRQLGVAKIRLMTNNPAKIAALERHGIIVAERVAHAFTANSHNHRYLETKARRGGHLL